MLTVDQFLAIHGPNPTPKKVPPRPKGPPRSIEEIRGEQDAERLYGARPVEAQVTTVSPHETIGRTPPHLESTTLPPEHADHPRPKARLKPMLVSPTDPTYAGAWTPQPCRQLMVIEVEVEDVGIIEYPVACETIGSHVGQPHMARIRGVDPATDRPYADVFVGWYEDGPPA